MARDRHHFLVRELLEREGWKITHDPYFLYLGKRRGFIDLGAEMSILGAEKNEALIAVEIKSFLGLSEIDQFEDALGQFLLYRPALNKKEPQRTLYLALPLDFYSNLFDDPYFQEVAELYDLKMLVYDEKDKTMLQWKG